MIELIAYIKTHGVTLVTISYLLVLLLDAVTSLTPTKEDDLFAERVGKLHRKIFAFFKLPNTKREGGSIIIPQGLGKHQDKKSEG